MGRVRLSRRERERSMHRQQMLEAAERVFVRDGYRGATIERTAQEADFAVGTLYNFFKSKEELFGEVITKLASEVLALLEEKVFNEADPLAALEALIDVRLTFPLKHRGFARVFFEAAPGAAVDLSSSLPDGCRELYDRYVRSVVGILESGMRSGVFRAEDPLYVTLCLEGVFRNLGVYWIKETTEVQAEAVEKVKRILLGMVCRENGRIEEGHVR